MLTLIKRTRYTAEFLFKNYAYPDKDEYSLKKKPSKSSGIGRVVTVLFIGVLVFMRFILTRRLKTLDTLLLAANRHTSNVLIKQTKKQECRLLVYNVTNIVSDREKYKYILRHLNVWMSSILKPENNETV